MVDALGASEGAGGDGVDASARALPELLEDARSSPHDQRAQAPAASTKSRLPICMSVGMAAELCCRLAREPAIWESRLAARFIICVAQAVALSRGAAAVPYVMAQVSQDLARARRDLLWQGQRRRRRSKGLLVWLRNRGLG